MKGDDPEIDTAQTPERFDGRLALQNKIRETFADSIPDKETNQAAFYCSVNDYLHYTRIFTIKYMVKRNPDPLASSALSNVRSSDGDACCRCFSLGWGPDFLSL